MNNKKNRKIEKLKDETKSYIYEKIKDSITINGITCKEAHNISIKLGISPQIVGIYINTLNVKLNSCQLGLFGGNNISIREKKIKNGGTLLQLIKCILEIEDNDRLNCKYAWCISKKLNLKKLVELNSFE